MRQLKSYLYRNHKRNSHIKSTLKFGMISDFSPELMKWISFFLDKQDEKGCDSLAVFKIFLIWIFAKDKGAVRLKTFHVRVNNEQSYCKINRKQLSEIIDINVYPRTHFWNMVCREIINIWSDCLPVIIVTLTNFTNYYSVPILPCIPHFIQ